MSGTGPGLKCIKSHSLGIVSAGKLNDFTGFATDKNRNANKYSVPRKATRIRDHELLHGH